MKHCRTCGAILPEGYHDRMCLECRKELKNTEAQIRDRQRKACGGAWMRRVNPLTGGETC